MGRATNRVAPNSPRETANAKPAPTAAALATMGRSTSRQVRAGVAPSTAAASLRRVRTDLIPGAIFTERETQEMMGVEVVGIPDGRRLFIGEDVPEGVYPWRKDETGPEKLLRVLPGRKSKGKGKKG